MIIISGFGVDIMDIYKLWMQTIQNHGLELFSVRRWESQQILDNHEKELGWRRIETLPAAKVKQLP